MHVGTGSSWTPGTLAAASRLELPKLRLPATSPPQGLIGGFRITLCCSSELDWLSALVAHGHYNLDDRLATQDTASKRKPKV